MSSEKFQQKSNLNPYHKIQKSSYKAATSSDSEQGKDLKDRMKNMKIKEKVLF